ncbi:hypothetical protein ABPG72_002741 [Tetrahymena utriculariae]
MGKKVQEQNFKFLIDTGSQTSWVQAKNCTSCLERNKNKVTRSCEHDTCSNYAGQHGIPYGIGWVKYFEVYDYFVFEDLQQGGTLTLKVYMGHVTEVSKELQQKTLNGLLGLQPKSNSKNPFILQFKNIGKIDNDQVFSINFRKQDSSLIIGGIKQNLIPQNKTIQYIPMEDGDLQWKISLQDFKIGNFSILNETQKLNPKIPTNLEEPEQNNNIEKEDQLKAQIDSGTNSIVLEQNLIEYFSEVLNSTKYNITCLLQVMNQTNYSQLKCKNPDGRIDNFPPLSFTFIDQNDQELVITIPPKQYVEDKIVDGYQYLTIINFLNKNKNIDLDKQSLSRILSNELILGQPFLQNLYVVFDKEKQSIGFVQLDPQDYQICQTQIIIYILVGFTIMSIGYSAAKSIIKKIF